MMLKKQDMKLYILSAPRYVIMIINSNDNNNEQEKILSNKPSTFSCGNKVESTPGSYKACLPQPCWSSLRGRSPWGPAQPAVSCSPGL